MKSNWFRKLRRTVWKTMKWVFIVFLLYLGSLFFRPERLPVRTVELLAQRFAPTNLVVHCDSLTFGFRRGFTVQGLRVFDRTDPDVFRPMASADVVEFRPLLRRLRIVGARYDRLPAGYYAPGNHERNGRVEATLPDLGVWRVRLDEPDILAVRPLWVETDVEVTPSCVAFTGIRLKWREADCPEVLRGTCAVDLAAQRVRGDVRGFAKQSQIRPLLVAIDIPVALPYMDAFTEVPSPVDAYCGWDVNLVNNDLDLSLDLHPEMGRYAGVPFRHADGKIHVHAYTRGDCLNYRTTVGPVVATGEGDRRLEGTVTIVGTNGYNTVTVSSGSTLPIGELLRVGGFEDEYVPPDVVGQSTADLEFRFPRAMTNNYEVLNGGGHVEIRGGRLLRLPIFSGMTEQLADKVPGISFLVDQSQATGDYAISNGVVTVSNVYIEGGVFSIRMDGTFDARTDALDFTVRAQFMREDTMMGRYFVHPVTWPFVKLLLEFRLTGSASEPKWQYISILDRIMDAFK